MNAHSAAYLSCTAGGKSFRYHFTGITAVEHSLSLNLEKDSSQGSDIINGARNRPDQVILSVVESDAEHGTGWSARMLEAMAALKRNRYLCTVATPMGTYRKMLLTEISARQDEENPCGWSGSLTFVEYVAGNSESVGGTGKKANNNSSTRKNTGSSGTKKVTGSAFLQLLQRAGIK